MIVVIGAGIAGLSLGWVLARAGADVTILEKDTVAAGASGAAGAYLEPRPGTGKLRALEWAALKVWPEFAEKLERESGLEIGHSKHGVTYVAGKNGLSKIKKAARVHSEFGWQVDWLEGDALRKFEPGLSANIVGGYFLPQVQHIDARKTCRALALAFKRNRGKLREGTAVSHVLASGSSIQLKLDTGEKLNADKVVIAAGHGGNAISGLPSDIPMSRPVRGILLEMKMGADARLVQRPLKTANGVILPLSDDRLLIGSSHEDGEDQLCAPDNVVKQILLSAISAVPEIASLAITETRIGIRSLVGDGLLRLGRSNEAPNIMYSLSHAGAGFLRAPVIATELAGIILDTAEQARWISPFFRVP